MCIERVNIVEKGSITKMYKVFYYSPSSNRYYILFRNYNSLTRIRQTKLSNYLTYKPRGGYIALNLVTLECIRVKGYHGFKTLHAARKWSEDKDSIIIVEFTIPPTATVYEGKYSRNMKGVIVDSTLAAYKVIKEN